MIQLMVRKRSESSLVSHFLATASATSLIIPNSSSALHHCLPHRFHPHQQEKMKYVVLFQIVFILFSLFHLWCCSCCVRPFALHLLLSVEQLSRLLSFPLTPPLLEQAQYHPADFEMIMVMKMIQKQQQRSLLLMIILPRAAGNIVSFTASSLASPLYDSSICGAHLFQPFC